MQAKTLAQYKTRARNFYVEHCGSDTPSSAQICAALTSRAHMYCTSSFRVLKNVLVTDQYDRGEKEIAKTIREVVNPTTSPEATHTPKPKPTRIKTASDELANTLISHLHSGGFEDEAVCVYLAHYLGVRQIEMRTITTDGNRVHIVGGKKSKELQRGMDRTLVIEDEAVLKFVKALAHYMSACDRTDGAIRDRLRKECRRLWPRRKTHPTLRTFRHQMGSNLKASGLSEEVTAYIMGHQSTGSLSQYGDRRQGTPLGIYVKPAPDADLSQIRKPKKVPRFGRGSDLKREAPVQSFERGAEIKP